MNERKFVVGTQEGERDKVIDEIRRFIESVISEEKVQAPIVISVQVNRGGRA